MVLLYGAVAVGAALASVIVLLVSELWLPFGAGSVKPANDVIGAWARGDVAWVLFWMALMLGFGLFDPAVARGRRRRDRAGIVGDHAGRPAGAAGRAGRWNGRLAVRASGARWQRCPPGSCWSKGRWRSWRRCTWDTGCWCGRFPSMPPILLMGLVSLTVLGAGGWGGGSGAAWSASGCCWLVVDAGGNWMRWGFHWCACRVRPGHG